MTGCLTRPWPGPGISWATAPPTPSILRRLTPSGWSATIRLYGNKRTGFLAAYVFLDLNGWELAAPEAHTAAAVLALADGGMDEAAFAAWLREHAREKSETGDRDALS